MKRLTTLQDLRSEILEVLQSSATPLQVLEISKRLRLRSGSEEYEHLRDLLAFMADEGTLERHSRRRFSLPRGVSTALRGVLQFRHGAATVQTKDKEFPVVHIRREHMGTALDGDTVELKLHAIPSDRKIRGEVVRVLERSATPITGRLEYDGSFTYVISDEARIHVDFLVSNDNRNGARPGDKVLCSFVRWEHAHASPEVAVIEVIGTSGAASVEFAAVRKEFRLPKDFPGAVLLEAMEHSEPPLQCPPNRTDLSNELIITIDPDDAKDFDDALSMRHLDNGNVELGVHIADVSHYVTHGSELDNEARKRGNSTYLVDGVVPMLPEHLSNSICSLVPNKPRLAYSVFMEYNSRATRVAYRIEETLIVSKRRFTYDEVQKVIDTSVGDHQELIADLHSLARRLFAQRMKKGGIDFETQEVKFVLDEGGMPERATVKTRTDATSLVEECMLAANRCVAEHVKSLKKSWRLKEPPPFLYRVHDRPDRDKLASAVAVIRALGISVPSGELAPTSINNVLEQAAQRPDKAVVNTLLLRSMSKAIYSGYNIGHYGLGFPDYAHFTSPIRRYPDLWIHRALKEYASTQPDEKRMRQLLNSANTTGDHCSVTERTSVEAERASVKCAQTILAARHIGEDKPGVVTGVTQFGVFVTLGDLMIEGLLHMRDMDDDYYTFDEQRMRIVGRKTKRVFQYGTELSVRIVRANVHKRTIDVMLTPDSPQRTAPAAEPPTKTKTPRQARRRSSES